MKEHFSINQIATKLGKTYPYIHQTVQGLLERGILLATPVGRSHLCTLNLQSEECVAILTLIELERTSRALKRDRFLPAVVEAVRKANHGVRIWTTILVGDKVYTVVDDPRSESIVAILGSIPYSNMQALGIGSLSELLVGKDASFREDRVILQGFENYFMMLAGVEEQLGMLYSPLGARP